MQNFLIDLDEIMKIQKNLHENNLILKNVPKISNFIWAFCNKINNFTD